MPSWVTLNLRAGASFNQHLSLQVMLENLTDRNYRYFASGVSAPGRNLSVSLRASF
jgi:hemoglobin/transferrin/lactoferrin receptor protein